MAKIYVSSTFIDLQDYRAQVERVIRRMGHEDVTMKYFVAEDQRPVDKCLADVAACDLYIGIFAWRYGWIPTKKNRKKLSITELEYHQAEKTAKPCLIFLLDGKASWPPDFIDDDKTQIKRLRNELSEKHSTGPGFKSVDELGRLVAEAIHKWEKEHGYIPIASSIPEYNLDAYYQALRKRYQTLALEGLTPPQKEEYLQIQLRSVFVEQNVRESPPPVELPKEMWEKLKRDKDIHPEDFSSEISFDDVQMELKAYSEMQTRPVLNVLTDSLYHHTIILGDPGSGKSTLARYIMLSLIEPTGDEKLRHKFDGYLPLLIELRTYVGLCLEKRCETPLEFFEHLGKTEGWSLTKDALHNHLKNDGRAVVIFDGLDEIFDPEHRERVTHQIVGFANDYPKTRIIVTSRVIGYRRKILTDSGFTHFTLQDLDEKQVETFVNRWYDLALSDRPDEAKERQERILKSFKESASIRQLAGNPMLLTIMAIIGKHQELPRERWKLYDHAASVLIQHWCVNKHLKDQRVDADFIGEEDKKELLRRLAFKMQGAEGGLAGNYIHRDQLQAEFEGYLTERYSQTPDRAKVIAEAMIQQFRERNFILSLYGANLYGFVHRAFLEFFCASAFKFKFTETREIDIEYLKHEVYGKHWKDQSWHEVLRLICGMIDEKWAGEIIEYLANEVNRPWPKEFGNFPPLNISLAVQCLGEVRNVTAIAAIAKLVLQEICSLYDHGLENDWKLFDFLDKEILSSVELISSDWPQRHMLINWIIRPKNFRHKVVVKMIAGRMAINVSFNYARSSGLLMGTICAGLSEAYRVLIDYSVHNNEIYRIIAIFAIAKGWSKNPKTFKLLKDHATNDIHKDVRLASIMTLAEYFSNDPQTLPLIRYCAINDVHEAARFFAIRALAKNFKNDPETLPLLRTVMIKSAQQNDRIASIYALAENFQNEPNTLSLICDCAVNDMQPYIRRAALLALINFYQDYPNIFPIIKNRAINDSDGDVRSTAVYLIAKHFRNEPDTLLVLQDRAANDDYSPSKKDYWLLQSVRLVALRSLVEYFKNDVQTLPLLHNRAVKDKSPMPEDAKDSSWETNIKYEYEREFSIETIAQYWPDHPDTLPLLEDRAKNDPTHWLRDRAKELIKELTKRRKEPDKNLTKHT